MSARPAVPKGVCAAVRSTEGGQVSTPIKVPLWRAAHGRTGDKGNRSNISVIAWSEVLYPHIEAQITAERVAAHFRHRAPSQVVCHRLPNLQALNFVLDDVLDGGVNDALNLDSHGKALSFHLLELELEIPDNLVSHLRGPSG